MAHRLKSKFDSRGRPGVESLWGQRTSGTKKFRDKEVRRQRGPGTKMFGEKRDIGKLKPLGTKKIGDREDWGQRRQRRAGEALESSGSLWGQRRSGTKEAEESRGAFRDKEVWGQRRQGRAWGASGDKEIRGQRSQGRVRGASGDKEVRGQRRKVEPPFQSCWHSRRHSRWQFTNKIIESVTN